MRRRQRRRRRWRRRANPARQTAAGGAPDCPSPGRRRPPMIRAGRQAAGATGTPPRHCVLYASLPSFLQIVCYFINCAFLLCMENGVFFEESPIFMHRATGGGCRISGQNFFEIRRKKLLTNPPESCIIRPSERMRGVAGVSHPGIRAFRRRCYVEQNIRKSKKRGNGVSHPGACCLAFSLLHCSRRRQDVRHAPKS